MFSAMVLVVFFAAKTIAQQPAIFSPKGIAIKGYDVVAFFTEHKPVMGFDSLQLQNNNAIWYFSTKQNLDSFKANPDKYIPQYGGYCAFGTAQGHKAPTMAETWTIDGDKLYFNYNLKVKELWDKDRPNLIKKADENWPSIQSK